MKRLALCLVSVVNLSRRMRKPTICIGENKGADQLRSNCEADQRLCFRYTDSTIPLLSKSKTTFCDSISPVCVGLGRDPNCWFSHAPAHFTAFLYSRLWSIDMQICNIFRNNLVFFFFFFFFFFFYTLYINMFLCIFSAIWGMV